MGMILRRIAVENFRKLREPHELSGLHDGLNILIGPNETGKSTIMEAVRAALFLRHGSKTQLIQSFVPYGDSVGPEVQLDFEIGGARYSLTKRFMARPIAELEGPDGRRQGDAAEDALQELLGFEKQSTRFDSAALGTLGLLWVAQGDGLTLPTPGDRVREGLGGALEDQAGALLGSAAFEPVRERIEAQYNRYKTPTGQKKAELKDAEARVIEAEDAVREAEQQEAALEQAYADLERKKGELDLVVAELADEEDAERKRQLEADLETAKNAAQKLETEQARHDFAKARVVRLEDLAKRHEASSNRLKEGKATLEQLTKDRAILAETLAQAKRAVVERGAQLKAAREARDKANKTLAEGRKREAQGRQRADVARARERHRRLLELEGERERLAELAASEVPAETIDKLEQLDTRIAAERNTLHAGGVRVAYSGPAAPRIGGQPLSKGPVNLTGETTLAFPDGGELTVHPPAGLAGAEARLASLESERDALLADWEVGSLNDLRKRDRDSRDAMAQLSNFAGQIEALTHADRSLGLAAGPEALKLFISEHAEEIAAPLVDEADEGPSVTELEAIADTREADFVRSEERNEGTLVALRRAEKDEREIASRETVAKSECERAQSDLAGIGELEDFAELDTNLAEARIDLARRAGDLDQATRNASAFDKASIARQIDAIDRQREKTGERRSTLRDDVNRLEVRIETDGGRGLAERAALARDEAEAARASLRRIQDEADMLTLLRAVLQQAQEETSRSLVGPVASRAKAYMQRVLPGLEPGFDADFQLASVSRGGLDEDRELLSQGTQEQLALLSRLAFAELLREEGAPVSLMLDDPLVYSDDYRLQEMINLLDEASRDMQIIVLSCRDRAFRAAPGERLELRTSP